MRIATILKTKAHHGGTEPRRKTTDKWVPAGSMGFSLCPGSGFRHFEPVYGYQRTETTEMWLPNESITVPCAPFSDGEVKSKYRSPDSGHSETPSIRQEPIYLLFSPWLGASVVQRSCLWLRPRRAAFQGFGFCRPGSFSLVRASNLRGESVLSNSFVLNGLAVAEGFQFPGCS